MEKKKSPRVGLIALFVLIAVLMTAGGAFAEKTATGFDSQFNGTTDGWVKKAGGEWFIKDNKFYATRGKAGIWSSAYYKEATYEDFVYTARVKRRTGTGINCMAVRMGAKTDATTKLWYPGYYFCYWDDGTYGIDKCDPSVTCSSIQPSTPTEAVVKNGWNVLKVAANGTSFKFYINSTLVKSFFDSMRSSGYVGFMMVRETTDPTLFMMDWAKLTVK